MVYMQGIAMPLIFLYRYRFEGDFLKFSNHYLIIFRDNRSKIQQIYNTNRSTGDNLTNVHTLAITKGW